jgi:hypothetical protein
MIDSILDAIPDGHLARPLMHIVAEYARPTYTELLQYGLRTQCYEFDNAESPSAREHGHAVKFYIVPQRMRFEFAARPRLTVRTDRDLRSSETMTLAALSDFITSGKCTPDSLAECILLRVSRTKPNEIASMLAHEFAAYMREALTNDMPGYLRSLSVAKCAR